MAKKPHYPPRQSAKPLLRPKLNNYIKYKVCMSKTAFAKALNVTPSAVTCWLYRKHMPTPHVIRRLAKSFGLTIDEVYDLFETVGQEDEE